MSLTRSEFDEWQDHPGTRQFKKYLREQIEEAKWLLMSVSVEDLKTLQERCYIVSSLMNLEYEEMVDANKASRPQDSGIA